MYQRYGKRVIDIFLCTCGLIVCCIPMLIIALAIKLDSKGPVIYKQERLGKDKKNFTILKFRTMYNHVYEMSDTVVRSDDIRITRVGSVLRRRSLDELPQMINIIYGNMSIIGPRPILPIEFEEYKNEELYNKRFKVLPGMFCTVDVKHRNASRDLQFRMDARYVERISLWLDIKTFLAVIIPVIQGKNVYRDEISSDTYNK